ncbi:hypothetical protein PQX77_012646 [Marasmius sp. AFHP31]|nr:hypothetical protein PQX77_012646 [Marasmius sp. AFHP31]
MASESLGLEKTRSKVEEIVKPEGYQPLQRTVRQRRADPITGYNSKLVCTSQPPIDIDASLADHPDGWSECLLTGFMKYNILHTANYPQPVSRTPRIVYSVDRTRDGRGLGMFATQDLKMGELILSERAIIIVAVELMRQPLQVPLHFTDEQIRQAVSFECESELKLCFDRVPEESRKAYLSLHNSCKHDGSGPIEGILKTNGLDLKGMTDFGWNPDGRKGHIGVFKNISRINHSCRPNACYRWDMVSFSMQIRAVRHMAKGEEITIPYIDVLLPASTRQRQLEPYGFQCSCLSCKNPILSDSRRLELLKTLPSHMNLVHWIMNYKLPDDHLVKASVGQIKLLQQEGLELTSYYRAHLQFLKDIYCAVKNDIKVLEMDTTLRRWDLATEGKLTFKDQGLLWGARERTKQLMLMFGNV